MTLSGRIDRNCVSDLKGYAADDVNNQKLQFQWSLAKKGRSDEKDWGARLMNSLEIATAQWAANLDAEPHHEAA